jgi:hypothetical protein
VAPEQIDLTDFDRLVTTSQVLMRDGRVQRPPQTYAPR